MGHFSFFRANVLADSALEKKLHNNILDLEMVVTRSFFNQEKKNWSQRLQLTVKIFNVFVIGNFLRIGFTQWTRVCLLRSESSCGTRTEMTTQREIWCQKVVDLGVSSLREHFCRCSGIFLHQLADIFHCLLNSHRCRSSPSSRVKSDSSTCFQFRTWFPLTWYFLSL